MYPAALAFMSSRGSPLRVRPEWLPLDNNKCLAKIHVNTPQSASFFCWDIEVWTRPNYFPGKEFCPHQKATEVRFQ